MVQILKRINVFIEEVKVVLFCFYCVIIYLILYLLKMFYFFVIFKFKNFFIGKIFLIKFMEVVKKYLFLNIGQEYFNS